MLSFETDDINSMSLYDQADILSADYVLLHSLNVLALSISKQQTCPVLRVTKLLCLLYLYPRLCKTRFLWGTISLNLHLYWSTLSLYCAYYCVTAITLPLEFSPSPTKIFLLSHYTLLQYQISSVYGCLYFTISI
jgi:hypothetical protein